MVTDTEKGEMRRTVTFSKEGITEVNTIKFVCSNLTFPVVVCSKEDHQL